MGHALTSFILVESRHIESVIIGDKGDGVY